jgi:photosystem II stability/assembly factor-like uncharacterized protein
MLFTKVLLNLGVAASLLATEAAVSAAAQQWVPATPVGGNVTALAQAPSNPQVVYAGTAVAGVFRSADGGETWAARNATLAAGDLDIGGFAVDPRDDDTVFAIVAPGSGSDLLLRSRDGGATWSPLRIAARPTSVQRLIFAGASSSTLLAATDVGLYRSSNLGASWQLLAFGNSWVSSVVEDPRRPGYLAATVWEAHTSSGRVWRSVDAGGVWHTTPLAANALTDLTPDPSRPGILYVLADAALYRSTNDGASWTALSWSSTSSPVGFAASPSGELYASRYPGDGVVRSADGGRTWTPDLDSPLNAAQPLDLVTQVLVSAADPREILAAGEGGVWRSADGGGTYTPANQGIFATSPAAVVVDAANRVLCTFDAQILRSPSQGAQWHEIYRGLEYPSSRLVADPLRPTVLYLLDQLRGSHDGGRTWQPLSPFVYPFGLYVTAFAIDPDTPDRLYVSGISYVGTFNQQDPYTATSLDGGTTWQVLARGLDSFTVLAIDPRQTATLYGAAGGDELWRSADQGQTWEPVGAGLPAPLPGKDRITALVVDPTDSQVVYAGTGGHGVYRSSDGGQTFAAFNSGLRTAVVPTLILDPRRPALLLAAAEDKGVFRWQPAAGAWQPLDAGLPLRPGFAGALAFDAFDDLLYTATAQGIYRLAAPDQP